MRRVLSLPRVEQAPRRRSERRTIPPAPERHPEQGSGPQQPPGLLFTDPEGDGGFGHSHRVGPRRWHFHRLEVVGVESLLGSPPEKLSGVPTLGKADVPPHLLEVVPERPDLAHQVVDRHEMMIPLLRRCTRCCTKAGVRL